MPTKNIIKKFKPFVAYHIYNRAINGSDFLLDEEDFDLVVQKLRKFLSTTTSRVHKTYGNRVDLLAFCVLPNHYHLLIRQQDSRALSSFMRSLSVSLTYNINKKYTRRGPLMESIYKARAIVSVEDLVQVSKYIHQNPKDFSGDILSYTYSSIANYIHDTPYLGWDFVVTKDILRCFNNSVEEYRKFILQ